MTTKAPSATPAAAMRATRPSPARVATSRTAPTTIEVLPPDTAVRCDRPATRICSASSGGCAVSSPTASPSTSAAAGAGAPSREARSDPRTVLAREPSGPAGERTVTRSASMTAAIPRRGSPSRSEPEMLTRAPMGGASSGDIRIMTGAPSSQSPRADETVSAWARTSSAGSPIPVRSRMSPMTVASTDTRAPTESSGSEMTVAAYDADDSRAAVAIAAIATPAYHRRTSAPTTRRQHPTASPSSARITVVGSNPRARNRLPAKVRAHATTAPGRRPVIRCAPAGGSEP